MNPHPSRPRRARTASGFTLVEVMVTMLLISMVCLGVFTGMQQITQAMTGVALRSEAQHLLQAEAERLLSSAYLNFVPPSADQTVPSCYKTKYIPSQASKMQRESTDTEGHINFVRHVETVTTTATSRTLLVEIRWSWPKGQSHTLSTVLYRPQSY